MQQKYSNMLFKFVWQFIIVLGLSMSANSDVLGQYEETEQSHFALQDENSDSSSFQLIAADNRHAPVPNSPAEESSSSEENGEEEKEETNDSDYDGELSHYQLEGLLDPFANYIASSGTSNSCGSYKIPLYILFHCWKNYLS